MVHWKFWGRLFCFFAGDFFMYDTYCGRIFRFLTGDLLWCTWVHWEGIFFLFHRYDAWCAWTIEEKSSTSSYEDNTWYIWEESSASITRETLLEMLEMLRKSLLLPYWEWCLTRLTLWGVVLSGHDPLGNLFSLMCLIHTRVLWYAWSIEGMFLIIYVKLWKS